MQSHQSIPEQVVRGGSIQLHRYANVTTGYQWSILTSPGLSVIHTEYHPSTEAQQGGGGGQTWTVRAIGTGRHYILLWNHKPWEKDTLEGAEILHIDIVEPTTPYQDQRASYQSPVPTPYQYPPYQYQQYPYQYPTNPYYQNTPYASQQTSANPYAYQQTPATNPYASQQAAANPYASQSTSSNPYVSQQTPTANPYASQSTSSNPYPTQQTPATNPYYPSQG